MMVYHMAMTTRCVEVTPSSPPPQMKQACPPKVHSMSTLPNWLNDTTANLSRWQCVSMHDCICVSATFWLTPQYNKIRPGH